MLETLLESKPTREHSVAVAVVSVTAHTALIAAAIYTTAQARVQPIRPPDLVRPIYFPRVQHATPESRATITQKPFDGQRPIYVEPHVDIKVPAVDLTNAVSKPSDFSPGPIAAGASNASPNSGQNATDTPFRAEQVEKQVEVVAGNAPPRYPEALRLSGVEGRVNAVFVVDEQGRVEEESIRFIRSDNRLFEDAVAAALRRMRFIPAETGGGKVRQLVEMPFVFTLSR